MVSLTVIIMKRSQLCTVARPIKIRVSVVFGYAGPAAVPCGVALKSHGTTTWDIPPGMECGMLLRVPTGFHFSQLYGELQE